MPDLPVHYQLLEFTQTYVHWVGDTIQPSHPVVPFSSHLQSFPASGSFQMSMFLPIRWPKYWSFSFSISPSNEYSGISFRMDWLDLLAVQGSLKSLLQHHSSKASILKCSAFFIVQLSHAYMTTGKTIALTRQTFVVRGRAEGNNFSGNRVPVFWAYFFVCSEGQCQVWWCLLPLKSFFPLLLPLSSFQLYEYGVMLRNGFQAGATPFLLSEGSSHLIFPWLAPVMSVRLAYRTGWLGDS